MSRSRTRTRTRDVVLVDEVRESPVDRRLLRNHRWSLTALVLAVLAAAALALAGCAPAAAATPPPVAAGVTAGAGS